MNVEEARKFANQRFIQLIQPIIDGEEIEPEGFNVQVESLKLEIAKHTGFQVESFYVQPMGFGLYDVTTVFKTGEQRRRSENALLYS